MSHDTSPGSPGSDGSGSKSSAYQKGLLTIAVVTFSLAFIRIVIDTWTMWRGGERSVDATSLGLLAGAALALLLLRVGPLTRFKWGDAEAEFSDLAGAVKNTAEITSRDLAARIDELKAILEKPRVAGDEGQAGKLAVAGGTVAAEPPALAQRVLYPDDPWKGRFGGKASTDKYTLSARFKKTPRAESVEVKLLVMAADTNLSPRTVEFFIHPTFPRERIKVRMTDGRANLDLLAWGGFTVGVWIAEDQTQLELDLAEMPNVPQIIRDN